MKKQYLLKKLGTIVLVAFLFATFTSSMPVSAANAPATTCSCVQYIKNTYGITQPVGNAKDMGTWLLAHGYKLVSNPVKGAIAVMQPTFPGANTTYGHVSFIESVTDQGTKWKITVRGAQSVGGPVFTQASCSNIRITSWSAYLKTNTLIKYYVKK